MNQPFQISHVIDFIGNPIETIYLYCSTILKKLLKIYLKIMFGNLKNKFFFAAQISEWDNPQSFEMTE